jgi:SHS2 domain-containing protein
VAADGIAAGGNRLVPHTADLRIEAWGGTREECLAEAVRGLVASFAEISRPVPAREVTVRLAAAPAEDLLVSALDEVIYRLDADDEIPAAAQVTPAAGGGAWLVLALVPAGAAEIIGAVPKAVALHGLRCAADAAGRWSASVTIDV